MNRDSNCKVYGCEYPYRPCELEQEFAGAVDAEDYYYFKGMERCEAIAQNEI